MNSGQRVMVARGPLAGLRATITTNEAGVWEDGAFVWIRYDRRNEKFQLRHGYETLSDRWFPKGNLHTVEG